MVKLIINRITKRHPTNDEVGERDVTVRVIDSGGLSDQGTFKLTVENVNDPPEFSSIPVLFGIQDEPYSYQVVAKDKDKDDFLSLDATIPSWLSFDISTGYLTGIPSNEDIWAGKTISL